MSSSTVTDCARLSVIHPWEFLKCIKKGGVNWSFLENSVLDGSVPISVVRNFYRTNKIEYGFGSVSRFVGDYLDKRSPIDLYLHGVQNDLHLGTEQFCDDVYGKSVAVIGPTGNESDWAGELNEFDLVVRTNSLFSAQKKCDVDYWNHAFRRRFEHKLEHFAARDTPQWLCLKSGPIWECPKLIEKPGLKTRMFSDASELFLLGFPLGIPNVLLDLMKFRPSRLKIFGVSSFLGKTLYRGDYIYSDRGTSQFSFADYMSCIDHDILENFWWLQVLLKRQFIEMDAVSESIHRLEITEFANLIDKQVRHALRS